MFSPWCAFYVLICSCIVLVVLLLSSSVSDVLFPVRFCYALVCVVNVVSFMFGCIMSFHFLSLSVRLRSSLSCYVSVCFMSFR